MRDFFLFLVRTRSFLTFAVLEIFALYCVYRYNNHGSAIFFNNTNAVVAQVIETQNKVIRYTKLNAINEDLLSENLALNRKLTALLEKQAADSAAIIQQDTAIINKYEFLGAESLNYTVGLRNNFITINKGTKDGITPGMGVICATGVVGKVKVCSEHMSLVTSILHSENLVSAQLMKSGKLGSLRWEGLDPKLAELKDVDTFETISVGDTVVTSNLNMVYPRQTMIGTVKSVKRQNGNQFLKILVNLSTDFRNLAYVTVVKNRLIEEQNTLEATVLTDKK